ncbi:TetR/AcrR family transcriptional regulator [Streptomyces lydicus]|uniref:TetR/AcrR family transcriptional regulator n=1 Tax=Streptomyces lydicus TaxID=47763 RepID=UPI0037B33DA0
MVVAAALPLVAEYGAAVTTSQIARAAGIGEATIFRAFKDKDEVLDACVAEAVGTDHVLRELATISLDEPLDVRLTEAAEALRAYMERMGTVVGTLHASGHLRPGRGGPGGREGRDGRDGRDGQHGAGSPPDARAQSFLALRDGVVELIEPDRDACCLSPEKVATAFLGLLFTRLHTPAPGAEAPLSSEELIAVLLHGSLKHPGSDR